MPQNAGGCTIALCGVFHSERISSPPPRKAGPLPRHEILSEFRYAKIARGTPGYFFRRRRRTMTAVRLKASSAQVPGSGIA